MFGKKKYRLIIKVQEIDDMFVKLFYYTTERIHTMTGQFPSVIDSIVIDNDELSEWYRYDFQFETDKKCFNAIAIQVRKILEDLSINAKLSYQIVPMK